MHAFFSMQMSYPDQADYIRLIWYVYKYRCYNLLSAAIEPRLSLRQGIDFLQKMDRFPGIGINVITSMQDNF